MFAVFRVVYTTQGPEVLGAWTLIQAAFAVARLPETGLSLVATRQAAIRLKKPEKYHRAWSFAIASLFVNCCSTTVLAIALTPAVKYFISNNSIDDATHGSINIVLSIALLSVVFQSALIAIQSLLDGLGRIRIRSAVTLFASPILPFLSYFLVPDYGLVGLAISNLALTCVTLGAVLSVYYYCCGASVPNLRLVRSAIRVNIRHGALFSLSGSLRAGFEPFTKYLVGAASGLSEVAIFEIALRGIVQVRLMIQSLLQPLLPKVPSISRSTDQELLSAYFELAVWASFSVYCTLLAASPLLSILFIGHWNAGLIVYLGVLAIGNILNCIGMLGYFLEIGRNRSRGVLRISIVMLAINVVGGAIGVIYQSALGVVSSYASAFGVAGIWGNYKFKVFMAQEEAISSVPVVLGLAGYGYVILAMFVYASPIESAGLKAIFVLMSILLLPYSALKTWRSLKKLEERRVS